MNKEWSQIEIIKSIQIVSLCIKNLLLIANEKLTYNRLDKK